MNSSTTLSLSGPSAERTSPAVRQDRWSLLFVCAVWAAMVGADLWLVAARGRNMPYYDDWFLVGYQTGHWSMRPAELWRQRSDHRVPLPVLLLLGLYRAFNNDFRAGMYFNVAALAAGSLVLVLAARKVRGRSAWTDAFLPLTFLSWTHTENLLWSYQAQFTTAILLASALLALLVLYGDRLAWPAVVGIGVCLTLLPLCGSNGMVMVPALATWLLGRGLRKNSWPTILSGAIPLGLCLAYWIGLEITPRSRTNWTPQTIAALFELLGVGAGAAVPAVVRQLLGAAVAMLLMAACLVLGRTWVRLPQERPRVAGLTLFGASSVALMAALFWGRYSPSLGWLAGRYAILTLPLWAALYFLFSLYGGQRRGPIVPAALCIGAAVMAARCINPGLELARLRSEGMDKHAAHIRTGDIFTTPPRYYYGPQGVFPSGFDKELPQFARWLRDAGHPTFQPQDSSNGAR